MTSEIIQLPAQSMQFPTKIVEGLFDADAVPVLLMTKLPNGKVVSYLDFPSASTLNRLGVKDFLRITLPLAKYDTFKQRCLQKLQEFVNKSESKFQCATPST